MKRIVGMGKKNSWTFPVFGLYQRSQNSFFGISLEAITMQVGRANSAIGYFCGRTNLVHVKEKHRILDTFFFLVKKELRKAKK